ncbi:ATPase [Clostridium sp. cel8]|jgi:cell division septum initiation protein DivIVA|uniref:ATPase n=1 Tax=unclassified Clostridium TaxID=2614128 RepID=UPI0015F7419C|nr:ATPase [Clostridium sp. cel8]MBA5850506.1 ATPase [Clostridium sp. cel8]
MDTISLLEYLEEIIETSAKVPMTGKVMVSKKEILDVINKIVNCLPSELKKAQWIVEEKERILSDAVKEADNMKKQNLAILRRQIENHDITREANKKAAEIISSAKKNAKAIRNGSIDYANDVLNQLDAEIDMKSKEMISNLKIQLQQFLDNLDGSVQLNIDSIRENIEELRNMK